MEILLNILCLIALISVVGFNIRTATAFPHYATENAKPGTVEVKTIDTGARQRRSVDAFPDELDVELSTDEMHISLHHLKRNFDIPNEFPVHLMRNGEVKQYSFESKRKVAYYFDTTSGAAFMAWPKSEQNGTAEEFDLYGTFISDNNEEYFVQPPKDKQSSYTVLKISEKKTTVSDYVTLLHTDVKIMQDKVDNRRNANNPTKRERRQTTTYEIEIFFVLDYAIYQEWYATTEGQADRESATIEYMTQFTAFLLNAINLRYQTVTNYGYTIRCLFAGIYIADTPDRAPFVENNLYPFGFVADEVLAAFKEWGETNLVTANYDHAMFFSGYEMGRNNTGVFDNATAGLAYYPSYNEGGGLDEPGVCGSLRYSINEGGGLNPFMATVGAHELGHNLGSSHDGSSNDCSGGYVMSASGGVSNDTADNLLLWIFSSCSQDSFDVYINDLNGALENCMTSRQATNANDLDPYVNDTAGQIYGPDVQCERMEGQGSYLSRSYLDNDYSNLCAKMPCSATANDGSVFFQIPWEGTTCGVGKVCQSGLCVESPSAPQEGNETCLFGDVPYNVPGQSSNCRDLLGSDTASYKCYIDSYRESCCATCEEIKQNNTAYTDCEYGDRYSNCDDLTDTNLFQCNDTDFRAGCCKSCVDKALDIPDCEYGDRYSNCDDLTNTYLYQCNDAEFRAGCCKSCADKALDIPGNVCK
ncbi:zinc metalloproteinase/disintegrin-like isoform X2 [Mercenaria mercenaria]|uniref:zinc metalloproteinase/disintegrin-like isoform X2 n=1 Tax=Mercenaria mercenaria TaxID=6596 RepID=UPI00234E53EB|nr:zinc metalloproteinase/disintegrin-like isoform X2 [Mercenaria mercenaria]